MSHLLEFEIERFCCTMRTENPKQGCFQKHPFFPKKKRVFFVPLGKLSLAPAARKKQTAGKI